MSELRQIPLSQIRGEGGGGARLGRDDDLLIESIRSGGQIGPLVVLEGKAEDGKATYDLVDGFRRAHAMRELGMETALAAVYQTTELSEGPPMV